MLYHFRLASFLALLFLLLTGAALINFDLRSTGLSSVARTHGRFGDIDPRIAAALSFGHEQALVDWLWIRALADLTVHKVRPGERASLFYPCNLATELDPLHFYVYFYCGTLLSIVRSDGEGAKTLLERGEKVRTEALPTLGADFKAKFWPEAWRVPATLAYTYLFELNQPAKAVSLFLNAGEEAGALDLFKSLANRLKTAVGRFEVYQTRLEMALKVTKDPLRREQFLKRHQHLKLEYWLFTLNKNYKKTRLFTGGTDPLGGKLILRDDGMIDTETEYERVFDMAELLKL